MLARQTLPLIITYVNNGEPIEGRTRFQKMIFLLQEHANFFKHRYIFIAHDYGPYSPELQGDIDDLIKKGFLVENRETVEAGKIKYEYVITAGGASVLRKILSDTDLNKKFKFDKIVELAEEIKKEVNRKDLHSLLSEIYQEYPAFAKYSQYEF